jgi:hypothetical protein
LKKFDHVVSKQHGDANGDVNGDANANAI